LSIVSSARSVAHLLEVAHADAVGHTGLVETEHDVGGGVGQGAREGARVEAGDVLVVGGLPALGGDVGVDDGNLYNLAVWEGDDSTLAVLVLELLSAVLGHEDVPVAVLAVALHVRLGGYSFEVH
jgi:hypothetical protein